MLRWCWLRRMLFETASSYREIAPRKSFDLEHELSSNWNLISGVLLVFFFLFVAIVIVAFNRCVVSIDEACLCMGLVLL